MPKHRLTKKRVLELFGVGLEKFKGTKVRRLSEKELEAQFGIRPQWKPSGRKRAQVKDINDLFDEMYRIYGDNSLEVFKAAAAELHGKVLHRVAECPQFVVEYMQRRLSPEEIKPFQQRQIDSLHASIERAQTVLRRLE